MRGEDSVLALSLDGTPTVISDHIEEAESVKVTEKEETKR